jgi:hypothetical protein
MLDAHAEGWHGLKIGLHVFQLMLSFVLEKKDEDMLVFASPGVLSYSNFNCEVLQGMHQSQ